MCSVEYGHTEIVKVLLDLDIKRGVDPSLNNNEILSIAHENNHKDIVEILFNLDKSRGVNPLDFTHYPSLR